MKKLILLSILSILTICTHAQQYALFGTKTLFDAFENPAVAHFRIDYSRQFSTNFFLPTIGLNTANTGNNELFIRRLINEQVYRVSDLEIGNGEKNQAFLTTNIYLFAFKLYQSYKYNKEIGVSYQIRSDAQATYTNEMLAIFSSFKRFADQEYSGVFNGRGYAQTYHQFSLSYREDIDKRLSLGVKASLLSGVLFNSLNITDSYLNLNTAGDQLDIAFTGVYKSNFNDGSELSKRDAYPLFKHPGLSISAGFKYNAIGGYQIMGNIKDLGFIRWNNKSFVTGINANETFNNLAASGAASRVANRLTEIVEDANQPSSFYSLTNAKADVYVSKTYGNYKPAIILSKNLFYKGGDVAFVNTYTMGGFAASLTPTYNFNKAFMVGLQGMYKSENFEMFLGSDNIAKTIGTVKGLIKNDATYGSGYSGASIYMGIGFKFGKVIQHPLNSDVMPGVGEDVERRGLLRRIFSKKN